MSDEATPSRSLRVAMALATAGALTILGSFAWTLTTPAPPRPVAFVGSDHGDDASCLGAVAWDGRVAHAACAWSYRDRALVELDPETAQATALHRWSLSDGNTPDLRILRACGDGELFVLEETSQTTLVTRRADDLRAYTAKIPGSDVLGATCVDHGVDLFVAENGAYAVHRVTDATVERLRAIPAADVAGTIVGAWFEDDGWHAVATTRTGEILAGPLATPLAPVGAVGPAADVCAIGQPGGWLGFEGRGPCFTARALVYADGAFRVSEPTQLRHGLVVDVGPMHGYGVTLLDEDLQFRGRGGQDFDLHTRDRLFTAQRGQAAPVVVAQARYSSLALGARALPLAGERVAVWGGLGKGLLILGPDLRRVDEPGLLQRTLSPFGRFKQTSKSTFDQICYFTLLAASLVWLLILSTYRRGTARHAGYRRAAVLLVVLFAVGARGFHAVLAWM